VAKFPMGQLLSTPGAIAAAEAAGDNLLRYIARHTNGDWARSMPMTNGQTTGHWSKGRGCPRIGKGSRSAGG
jgi:hypothetical protein